MAPYDLMIKANHYLIDGGELTDAHKANIVRQLLNGRSTPDQAQRFYRGVRTPNNIDRGGMRMYPVFYIPPYNDGKKYQTVIPMSPQTHILSANAYELEIIRLLCMFASDNPVVKNMGDETITRLKTTCFGYKGCVTGECFHASLIVLRFLIVVRPREQVWMRRIMAKYHSHVNDVRRHSGVKKYFELCMKELNES
ncbi:MAG: hypothetical protein FWD03_05005 [Defluviitaleaceae bacterium]|nr:hypothetical protein [Defluviitaleaceae bacterium]